MERPTVSSLSLKYIASPISFVILGYSQILFFFGK